MESFEDKLRIRFHKHNSGYFLSLWPSGWDHLEGFSRVLVAANPSREVTLSGVSVLSLAGWSTDLVGSTYQSKKHVFGLGNKVSL